MRRSAILIGVGLVGALIFACTPPQLPAPGAGAASSAGGAAPCAFNASAVVQSLAATNASGNGPFNAATYGNCDPGSDPNCAAKYGPQPGGPSLNQNWVQTIQNAYNMAQPAFQTAMCGLKYIYIDNNPGSPNRYPWGMRERAAGNIRHIGLPAGLFSNPSYSTYETNLLNGLLGAAAGTTTVTSNPDNLNLKILAVLSHEMAHILWWHHGVANKSCGTRGNFFKSWQSYDHNPPHGFHQFGVAQSGGSSGNMPNESFLFQDVQGQAGVGRYGDLETIYSDGQWPSLFGFVAPDEDFAETYKLAVISPSLVSLTTTIPSQPATDIMQVLRNNTSVLSQKADWIANCLN